MTFDLSIRNQDDYLRFEVSGRRVRGKLTREMLAVWTRVAEAARESGVHRVLGLNRLTGAVPALEVYRIGEQVPALFAGAVSRLAFVVLGGEEAVRANLFFENVAVNRGLTVRIFDDEAAALAWLLED